MAADRKLIVQIVGDSKSAEKAFARVNKAAGGFGSKLKSLGKIAAVGVGAAFVGLGIALNRGFKELAQAQVVMAQTNAVLKSTGGVANVTAKHVDQLATSLSRMSGIDDEVIAGGENMLLTFTNVRNAVGRGPKIFDLATQAVLDLSVATGKDMTTAAIMVGKALNDTEVNSRGTISGWSALRRVGVMITQDMMAQAAAFIKAGKPMKAQQLLLRELNTEFGGSAAAFGKTMPGALGRLRNAFDELMAAFATGFLPLILKVSSALESKLADPEFVARVRELGTLIGTKLLTAFQSISQWFNANWPTINTVLRTTLGIFRMLIRIIRTTIEVSATLWTGFLRGIESILGALGHLPKKLGGGKFTAAEAAVRTAREAVEGQTPAGKRRAAVKRTKTQKAIKGASHLRGYPRQHGGPVMPNVAYTVGEAGPETFVPGRAGNIVANGGGGIHLHGPVYVTAPNPRAFMNELQRIAKGHGGQTRGRMGGQKLALG